MNRKELVAQAAKIMRDGDVRKCIPAKKQVFRISDSDGNKRDFIVKNTDKSISFTAEDIDAVLEACLMAIEDSIKKGEGVTIRGFGTLGLNYRKARSTKHPDTGEVVNIDAHYVPKFTSGKNLKMCAKVFELSLEDSLYTAELPLPDDEDII